MVEILDRLLHTESQSHSVTESLRPPLIGNIFMKCTRTEPGFKPSTRDKHARLNNSVLMISTTTAGPYFNYLKNKWKGCRGRLAQWKSVCLQIQRSEFDSARQQMSISFVSVADKYTQLRFIRKISLQLENQTNTIYWRKADFTLSLWVKGTT